MALIQLRVQVPRVGNGCDTTCNACATVRGIIAPELTVNGSGILNGTIVEDVYGVSVYQSGCDCYVTFEFDDDQLEPDVVLESCDVCMVCGCMVDFVERAVQLVDPTIVCPLVRECLDVDDTPSFDFSYNSATGVFSGNVIVSPNGGNALQTLGNGLFSPVETPLVANDSTSINFTTSGTAGHTLTGNIILDSVTGGNTAVITANGLFVPTPPPPPQTPITPVSTAAITLGVSGVNNHTLTADLVISAIPGNQASIAIDGLYVMPTTPTFITVDDTPSIHLTADGPENHHLEADLILSPDPANALQILPDGAFVDSTITPQTLITVVDSDSISGTATGPNNHTIEFDLNLSGAAADAGNVLVAADIQTTPNEGLRVQLPYASGSWAGAVSTGAQEFAGQKDLLVNPRTVIGTSTSKVRLIYGDVHNTSFTLSTPGSADAGVYSIPANGLAAVGDMVRFTMHGFNGGLNDTIEFVTGINGSWFPTLTTYTLPGTAAYRWHLDGTIRRESPTDVAVYTSMTFDKGLGVPSVTYFCGFPSSLPCAIASSFQVKVIMSLVAVAPGTSMSYDYAEYQFIRKA